MTAPAEIDLDAMLGDVLPVLLGTMQARGADPATAVFGMVIAQPGTLLHTFSGMGPREMYVGWNDPAGMRKLFDAASPAEAPALRALEARWTADDTPIVMYTVGPDGADVMTLAAVSRAEIAVLLPAPPAVPPSH